MRHPIRLLFHTISTDIEGTIHALHLLELRMLSVQGLQPRTVIPTEAVIYGPVSPSENRVPSSRTSVLNLCGPSAQYFSSACFRKKQFYRDFLLLHFQEGLFMCAHSISPSLLVRHHRRYLAG